MLLLAGSIADVVGSRITFLVGCFFSSMFTLACGLSRTGVQLIAFRALLGVAMALVLPSAVSIISHNFAAGHRRNIAFACMGGGQPLGFSLGLIIGGVFIDSIGWRWGYYISAAICLVLFAGAFWGLPTQHHGLGQQQQQRQTLALTPWQRLWNDIDWVGAVLIGASLGMMSYVLAFVSSSHTLFCTRFLEQLSSTTPPPRVLSSRSKPGHFMERLRGSVVMLTPVFCIA